MSEPRLRVAVIADYAEERWPSMDLVADMLHVASRRRACATSVDGDADAVPAMPARRSGRRVRSRSRARFLDYPRALAALPPFDVYHWSITATRTCCTGCPPGGRSSTCHDLDTFRSVLQPDEERRSLPFRVMTRPDPVGPAPRRARGVRQRGDARRARDAGGLPATIGCR